MLVYDAARLKRSKKNYALTYNRGGMVRSSLWSSFWRLIMVTVRRIAISVACLCMFGLAACEYDFGCKGEFGGPQECRGTISGGGSGSSGKKLY